MLKKIIISIVLIVVSYVAFSQESSTTGKPRVEDVTTNKIEPDFNDIERTTQPIYNKVL